MRKACWECARKRDLYRPVFRRCDGIVEWVCRQCWRRLEYEDFFHAAERAV